ncbi:MAG: hypothetical protein ACREBQ_05465, partial [Nitrososphaerales archaeon]
TLLRMAMAGRSNAGAPETGDTEATEIQTTAYEFRFPSLEIHGELEKCDHVAELIAGQHSMFACAR